MSLDSNRLDISRHLKYRAGGGHYGRASISARVFGRALCRIFGHPDPMYWKTKCARCGWIVSDDERSARLVAWTRDRYVEQVAEMASKPEPSRQELMRQFSEPAAIEAPDNPYEAALWVKAMHRQRRSVRTLRCANLVTLAEMTATQQEKEDPNG